MKFNTTLFTDLAERERHTYLSTTSFEFFGLRMQQIPEALLKINQILNTVPFDRVVEIGAGDGGLSCLLAFYCKIKNIPFYSFDIHDKGVNIKNLREITTGFEVRDVIFDQKNVEYVTQLIQGEGQTLCLFDAGKHVEFNVYASKIKPGDCVMLHDFARDEKHFEENVKGKVWNWLECTYAQIQEEAEKNNIVFVPATENVVWAFGYKLE